MEQDAEPNKHIIGLSTLGPKVLFPNESNLI